MKTIHWIGLALITLLSLILEFTSHHDGGHHHWWNTIPAFWILFGFIGCLILILVAKILGKLLLNRKEDYYDID
jgi:hypothetical protein